MAERNTLIHSVCWAGTFVCSGRNALMRRYVTMGQHIPSKVPHPVGDLNTHVTRVSPDHIHQPLTWQLHRFSRFSTAHL